MFTFILPASAVAGETCNANHSEIARMYVAFLNRMPEQEGLDYWTGLFDEGDHDLNSIAFWISQSSEFKELASNKPERQFIEDTYLQVLGRPGDKDGVDYWTNLNIERADKVRWISNSQEFRNRYPFKSTECTEFFQGNGYQYVITSPNRLSIIEQWGTVGEFGGEAAINGGWFTNEGTREYTYGDGWFNLANGEGGEWVDRNPTQYNQKSGIVEGTSLDGGGSTALWDGNSRIGSSSPIATSQQIVVR